MNSLLTGDGVTANQYSAGDARLHDGVRYASGILGQGFAFDGKAGYIDFGFDGTYGMHMNPGYTGRFWMRPARDGKLEVLMERLQADGRPRWRIDRLADGRIALEALRSERVESLVSRDVSKAGEWSSVATVAGSQGVSLYLNGVPQGELPVTIPPDGRGSQTRIGAGFRGSHFSGMLDEIAVWDRLLSAEQLKEDDASARKCLAREW